MSKKPTYFELLKDPRWQRRRLELLQSANFGCQNCGDATSTLHVHHGAYLKDVKPWDYPDDMMHVVCETCHVEFTELQQQFMATLGRISPCYMVNLIHIMKAVTQEFDKETIEIATFSFCDLTGLDERILMPAAEISRKAIVSRLEAEGE